MMHEMIGTVQPRHQRVRAGERSALTVLLGGRPPPGARRVDHREDGKPVALCELASSASPCDSPPVGHAEVPVLPLLDVATLLVPDQGDRPSVEAAERR